jgi:hypothetical protein
MSVFHRADPATLQAPPGSLKISRVRAPVAAAEAEAAEPGKRRSPGSPIHPRRSASAAGPVVVVAEAPEVAAAEPLHRTCT